MEWILSDFPKFEEIFLHIFIWNSNSEISNEAIKFLLKETFLTNFLKMWAATRMLNRFACIWYITTIRSFLIYTLNIIKNVVILIKNKIKTITKMAQEVQFSHKILKLRLSIIGLESFFHQTSNLIALQFVIFFKVDREIFVKICFKNV